MRGVVTVVWKEWLSFVGSDRGVFLIYGILVLTWSYLFSTGTTAPIDMGPVWMVLFSVVVSANFSATVFVSERTNGALEILLTSGLSRDAVLGGKMLFVVVVTTVIGLLCMALSWVWTPIVGASGEAMPYSFHFGDISLFVASSFMNVASSAFFSVRLGNPRVLHFVNLFIAAGLISIYLAAAQHVAIGMGALDLALAALGVVFTILARREFHGEKIVQTVVL